MKINKKIKAGALQYAIFISVVIGLVVFSVLSLSFVQNRMRMKSGVYKHTIEKTNDAFQFARNNDLAYDVPFKMHFEDEIEDSTFLLKSGWGIFDIVKATSKIHEESFRKVALMGGFESNRSTLYLIDLHRPLVLVGNAKIEGTVLLPEKGVKRGSMAGKSYYNEQLIYGNILKSNSELPILKNRETIVKLSQGILNDPKMKILDKMQWGSLTNSFFEEPLLVDSWEALILEDTALNGNILVHSDSLIVIRNTAKLEDIIVTAPHIIIEDGVGGNFQAIATKELNVGKDCILSYPTSLVLIQEDREVLRPDKKPRLSVDENSEIRGVVAYLTDQEEGVNNAQIYIGRNTHIIGEVYSEMNLELEGSVKGMVKTRGFIANQNGASYQNHIMDGRISEHELPDQYYGLNFEGYRSGIVKWLY